MRTDYVFPSRAERLLHQVRFDFGVAAGGCKACASASDLEGEGVSAALDNLLDQLGAESRPTLPVERLSPSSIEGFIKCPEQWRRERIAKQPSFATADRIFGTAFHRAAEQNFAQKISSREDIPVPAMRDLAGDSFNVVVEETKAEQEIRWYEDKPADVQAGVIRAMVGSDRHPGYHQVLAPAVQPVAVERWTEVPTPVGVPLVGKIDVETEAGVLIDLKTGKKAKTQLDLDKSIQATAYLYSREQEGNPAAGFAWHTTVRLKTQTNQQELVTARSANEIAMFDHLMVVTARTIQHYMDTYGPESAWPGTSPLSWFCAPTQCSFYGECCWRGGAK